MAGQGGAPTSAAAAVSTAASTAVAAAPEPRAPAPAAPPPVAQPPAAPPSGTPVPYGRSVQPPEQAHAPLRPAAPKAPVRRPVAAAPPCCGPDRAHAACGSDARRAHRRAGAQRLGSVDRAEPARRRGRRLRAARRLLLRRRRDQQRLADAVAPGCRRPHRRRAAARSPAGARGAPMSSRRAAYILSQSLVGTGAGVMLLGVVAGARIYAPAALPIVGRASIGAGVGLGARRRDRGPLGRAGDGGARHHHRDRGAAARGRAADERPRSPSCCWRSPARRRHRHPRLAVAAAGRDRRVAAAARALGERRPLVGDQQPMVVAVAVLVAWWALHALPALFFEVRADEHRACGCRRRARSSRWPG